MGDISYLNIDHFDLALFLLKLFVFSSNFGVIFTIHISMYPKKLVFGPFRIVVVQIVVADLASVRFREWAVAFYHTYNSPGLAKAKQPNPHGKQTTNPVNYE